MKIVKKNRSIKSRIFSLLFNVIPVFKDARLKKNYDRSWHDSNTPYQLPKSYEHMFNISKLDNIDTMTFEIVPDNGHIKNNIYYLHGGAYWTQPSFFHYKTLKKISNDTHSRIVIPVYPKSPRYVATDILKYVINNYKKYLSTFNLKSSDVTFMGDSAGGGLCLALAQLLKYESIENPKNMILLSPWLDVSNSNIEMNDIQKFDPMLNIEILRFLGQVYSDKLSAKNPLINPIYADYSEFSTIYIFSGTYDILFADARKLDNLKHSNVNLFVYPKMNHVFSLFNTPEAKDSLNKVYKIIDDSTLETF